MAGGRTTWLARIVTYGILAVLAFGVWNHTEAWPVTSYRLFSHVRTGTSSSLELVAVDLDGEARVVRPRGEVGALTGHQYRDLVGLDVASQRTLVRAWLDLAEIDPSTVQVVRLEQVGRQLDPDGGPSTETRRTVLVEVVP